jgi:hypothetical protein
MLYMQTQPHSITLYSNEHVCAFVMQFCNWKIPILNHSWITISIDRGFPQSFLVNSKCTLKCVTISHFKSLPTTHIHIHTPISFNTIQSLQLIQCN